MLSSSLSKVHLTIDEYGDIMNSCVIVTDGIIEKSHDSSVLN